MLFVCVNAPSSRVGRRLGAHGLIVALSSPPSRLLLPLLLLGLLTLLCLDGASSRFIAPPSPTD